MDFSIKENKGITIIALEGEMVGGPGATLLSDKLRELIASGNHNFILDLEKIAWMNSSGLGILMGSLTTVRNSGGNMKLLNVTDKIQELLRITKLNRVFEAYNEEDAAIGSFS